MLSLAELNALDRTGFTRALGHVFEHSPWIPGETWPRRPFRSTAQLHAELCATMRAAGRERQLTLIRAHPDLAGRMTQQNQLTAESKREQDSAGLRALTSEHLAVFQRLNDAYRERFGFPFIICARLNDRQAILAAMQARAHCSPEEEFQTALGEIEKIAQLRLADTVKPAPGE